MLRNFAYKTLLFLLPILILLFIFVIADPFRLIYQYNDYSKVYTPSLNRDFVSSETYINKHQKYHYNSFVFGSSRTLAYPIKTWQTHLNKDAIPFKFDASLENIFGIHSKIKYLSLQNDTIKNVLIIVCTNLTFSSFEDGEGILFMKHPKIAKTSSIKFYGEFVKAFFHRNFLINFFTNAFTNKQYHIDYIDKHGAKLDTINNDMVMQLWEKDLNNDPKSYYERRKQYFYKHDSIAKYNTREITAQQIIMLKEIKSIFDKHKTNYKIVISPLYEQLYFNRTDMQLLKTIFGANTIYDYSGINNYTSKIENYYEECHYRPHVGEAIISEIYK